MSYLISQYWLILLVLFLFGVVCGWVTYDLDAGDKKDN